MAANPRQSDTDMTIDHVAPLLPATADAPAPARRVNFFVATLFYWLVPKRLGPHLAVASFKRAFLAHVISAVLAGAIFLIVFLFENFASNPDIDALSLHEIRIILAHGVLELAAESAGQQWSWMPVVAVLAAISAIELLVLAVAVLAMPWCAGGDRTASVFRRSVKNVYWSTTFAIPLSIPMAVMTYWDEELEHTALLRNDMFAITLGLATVIAPVILILRMWLVGASRYVGRPDGPAFSPREPRCDECGYLVIGLPLDARCPECGLPVSESLPGGRRQPTAWERHQFTAAGMIELVRMQWRIVADRRFFYHLPVHRGLAAARHFWWGTFLVMVLVFLASVFIVTKLTGVFEDAPGAGSGFALLAVSLPFLAQSLMMFLACLWAQFSIGIRDYRVSAIVCYYATPLIWPLMIVLLGGAITLTTPAGLEFLDDLVTEMTMASSLPLRPILLIGAATLVIGLALWFWARCLARALLAVRYANV